MEHKEKNNVLVKSDPVLVQLAKEDIIYNKYNKFITKLNI